MSAFIQFIKSYLNRTPNKTRRRKAVGRGHFVGVLMHETAGYGSLDWNLRPEVQSSYNYLILRNGDIHHYVDERQFISWHGGVRTSWRIGDRTYVGGEFNDLFIGVEIEGPNNGEPITTAQRDSSIALLLYFNREYGIPLESIRFPEHKDAAPVYKSDAQGYEAYLLVEWAKDQALDTFTPNNKITEQRNKATPEQAITYAVNGGATLERAAEVASAYWRLAPRYGIDPLGAFAQMIHETDYLRSWWADKHKNMCGLGVTGVRRKATNNNDPAWQVGRDPGIEEQGYSFKDYESAVKAHLAHLVGYAYKAGAEPVGFNPADSPRFPALVAAGYRGIATYWKDLNGRWAVPGLTYADGISRHASGILRTVADVPAPTPPKFIAPSGIEVDPAFRDAWLASGGAWRGDGIYSVGWPTDTPFLFDGVLYQFFERGCARRGERSVEWLHLNEINDLLRDRLYKMNNL